MPNDRYKGVLKRIISAFFVAIFEAVFVYMWYRYYNVLLPHPFENKGNWLIFIAYILEVSVFQHIYGGFKIGYLGKWNVMFSQVLAQVITNCIMAVQIILMAGNIHVLGDVFSSTLLIMLVDLLISLIFCNLYVWMFERLFPPRKLLLIYGEHSPKQMISKMKKRSDKYHIDKTVSYILVEKDRLCEMILNYKAVLLYDISAECRNDFLKFCHMNNVEVYMTSKISDVIVRGASDVLLFDTPLLHSGKMGLGLGRRFIKRCMDIFISIAGLIVLSPVMLAVAIAIKCDDHGPVFFRQKRCTLGGKVFQICKFRSMIVNAEEDGKSRPAVNDDDRITSVGRFIRKTRIDEIPQLLNVLKGEMSIVGPRPERIEHVEKYTREIPEFSFRLQVKGGLTGYAQVYGKYNTTAYDKLKLDLMYIENYSFLLDIKLIFMTIKVMFMKTSTEGFSENEDLDY